MGEINKVLGELKNGDEKLLLSDVSDSISIYGINYKCDKCNNDKFYYNDKYYVCDKCNSKIPGSYIISLICYCSC